MRSTLAYFVLMLFLAPNTHATAVVVARVVIDGRWYLIIAADSKAQYIDGQGSPTVCKIQPTKVGLFAVSGYVREFGHYDVFVTVEQEFSTKGNFAEHVQRTSLALRKALSQQMHRLKTEQPKNYPEILKKLHGGAVSVLMVENDAFAFRVVKFDPAINAAKVTQAQDCPGKACVNGNTLLPFGQSSPMVKYLTAHPISNITSSKQLVEIARSTIQAAVDGKPADVGPPIEILQIDSTGRSWISNELGCSDYD
jgi:hypothetical protein